MSFCIKVASEKPEKRFYQRIKVDNNALLEDNNNNKYQVHINDISRSGIKTESSINLQENPDENFNINIQDEENEIEILSCKKNPNEEYTCQAKFKEPFSLIKITKEYANRLSKFVRFAYKKPDLWDNYFNNNNKKS